MNLKIYLHRTTRNYENETQVARYTRFADQVGVSLHTVYKWVKQERGISDKNKRIIQKATYGRVTLDDMVS